MAEDMTLCRHYDVFENCGDCTCILGTLRSRNMISLHDYEDIMAERTRIERNRKCLDIIIRRVKVLPEYFEQFCSILTTQVCFKSLVDSMVTFYITIKNEAEIQACIQTDKMLPYIEDQLSYKQKVTLFAGDGGVDRAEYFTEILKDKPKLVKRFLEYVALHDSPNHTELHQLHQWLQSSIESFKAALSSILENYTLNPSAAIKRYQDHLKAIYIDQFSSVDTAHQYVNLSLMSPNETETLGDYFKAMVDPYNLLFKHKEQSGKIMLKSLSEIFDASSRVDRQVVLIQGAPGSGKTTLANKICLEWAEGRLLQKYSIVILLKLRDFRKHYIDNIAELIHCSTGNSEFAFEATRELVSIDGDGMLLLLEGWDELPEERQRTSFFVQIIHKKIFTKASVLITSRPSSIGTIQIGFVTRNIAILGFSEKQINQYLDNFFSELCYETAKQSKLRFLEQLNSDIQLTSIACIPVNLSILANVFQHCGGRLPSSLTELYAQYLLLKLSHHYQRMKALDKAVKFPSLNALPQYVNEDLKKLGKLAFRKLKFEKLNCTEDDIKEFCFMYGNIPSYYDGMGLLEVENDILNQNVYRTYHFVHRTIQEFLAAWYLSQEEDWQKKEKYLKEIFDNKTFEVVWVFYAGLSRLSKSESEHSFFPQMLKHLLSDIIPNETLITMLMKAESLSTKLVIKNRNAQKIKILSSTAIEYHSMVSKLVSSEFLTVLISCCAEAQNPAACQTLSNSPLFYDDACCIKISDSAVTPQILSSLSYCIAHSGKRWVVVCPHLTEQAILSFHKDLDLSSISGELTALMTYTDKYRIDIFMMLIQSRCGLRYLDISYSRDFDDYCVILLANTLKHNKCLVMLELKGCNITSKGIHAVAEMLLVNNTLEWIDLTENSFSSADILQILATIRPNTSLTLLEVDALLVDKNVKTLLAEFNEGRKFSLRLNRAQALFKGSKLGLAVEWGVENVVDKLTTKIKDALQ